MKMSFSREYVRLNGKDFYLGRYGSAAAKAEYDRLITEWLAHGRQLPRPDAGLSIAELILAYVRWAETYYLKGGVRPPPSITSSGMQ